MIYDQTRAISMNSAQLQSHKSELTRKLERIPNLQENFKGFWNQNFKSTGNFKVREPSKLSSYHISDQLNYELKKPWNCKTQWNFTQKNESQSSISIEFQFHCLTEFLSPSTRLTPFPWSRVVLSFFHVQLITSACTETTKSFGNQQHEDDSAVIYRF